ncbi:N-acetylneuraminate lyase B-like [Anastrepha obliqua]|uniref:N-acetylneuraminate lyase B-like n=1 Tax=Anastrepha obliqua TaxID=95512 RepID=UPI0024095AD4|nr:N-acetylneuraminate lyase B-like [Anastrepha obliqua]
MKNGAQSFRQRRRSTLPQGLSPKDFKGLYVPVFTCFQRDEQQSLQLEYINDYAAWLKKNGIKGVLVNSTIGEGPALGLVERKLNAEVWSRSCKKHSLIMLLQIGGAPLPDVLDLARHANDLFIHGVLCIPELFYTPNKLEQLIGYCKIVAKKCENHSFFYYHLPKYTNVDFDMEEFCRRAESAIPNFAGLKFSQSELISAAKCLAEHRTILLGDSKMLASGMLLGFETAIMTVANMEPVLMGEIYNAMISHDLRTARRLQNYLNQLIRGHVTKGKESWVADMKKWFNDKMLSDDGCHIHVGEPRKLFS